MEGFQSSLAISKLKLPRTIAQEVAMDPGRDGALYFSGNGLGGLFYRANQRRDGLQTLQDRALYRFSPFEQTQTPAFTSCSRTSANQQKQAGGTG